MTIQPGIGLDIVRFGMTKDEVANIFGSPDDVIKEAYDEKGKERYDSWEYQEYLADLSFDEENDWRLSHISIYSDSYQLSGHHIVGLDKEELMALFTELQIDDIQFEDMSSDDSPNHHLFYSDKQQLNFWLDQDIVIEVQWSPFMEADETVIWPK